MSENDPTERVAHAATLMRSDAWEDRVRAAAILRDVRPTLPDGFPAIIEVEESPDLLETARWRSTYRPHEHVWVAHPDEAMLRKLLPEYQALWDSYTAQWGPSARRLFAVDRVDGIDVTRLRNRSADTILLDTQGRHSMPHTGLPERLRKV